MKKWICFISLCLLAALSLSACAPALSEVAEQMAYGRAASKGAADDPGADNLPEEVYPAGFENPVYTPVEGMLNTLPNMPEYTPPKGSLKIVETSVQGGNSFLGSGDKTWSAIPTQDESDAALYWRTPDKNGQIYCPDLPIHDFTEYTAVEFWMYSQKATGDTFSALFYGVGDLSYFRIEIKVSWTGWKKVSLMLSDMDSVRDCQWSLINSVRFNSSGWGCTLTSDTTGQNGLYFGDIYLTKQLSDYDVNLGDITADDLDEVRNRWKVLLAGNFEINTFDNDTAAKIRTVNNTAKNYANSMHMGDGITCLWDGLTDFKTHGGHIQTTYERLYAMAAAWATWTGELYHDQELLDQIIFGLRWMATNAYNEDTVSAGNWWQWQIGAPLALGRCVLLIEEELSEGDIKFFLRGLDHFTYLPSQTYANRAWLAYAAMIAAVCERDPERLATSVSMLMNVFTVTTSGDGFYADGSFIQHNAMPYIAGYGGTYFSYMSDLIWILEGTKFDIGDDYLNDFAEQFFDCCLPLMIRGDFACNVMGRTMAQGTGAGSAAGICTSMLKVVPLLSADQQKLFYENVLYFILNNDTFRASMVGNLNFFTIKVYKEMMQLLYDGYYVPSTQDAFARVYASMDRSFQMTDTYAAAISLSSTRIYRYEAINGENGSAWYTGDGALWIYTPNSKYDVTYFRNFNWYHIPGVTSTTATRTVQNIALGQNIPGAYSFAGGAALNLSSVTAMHFHGLDATQAAKVDGVVADLDAYKAWFAFDDEIVCLGAGITCKTAGTDVITTIENRAIPNDAALAAIRAAGSTVTLTEQGVSVSVPYVTFGAFGGYYFPESTPVILQSYGSATKFFEMYIPHGELVSGETYAYVMLPTMSEADVAAYAADPRIEILRNDTKVMAVREKTTAEWGYVFWEAAVYDGIATSAGAAIMKAENADGTLTFSIADPTQQLERLLVNVLGEYDVVSADGQITATVHEGYTTLTVDTNASLGADFTVTLRQR